METQKKMAFQNQQQENKPRYPRNPGFTGAENPPSPPAAGRAARVGDTPGVPPARVLTERKAPELFSFKAEGDVLDGILVRVDAISIKDKTTHQAKRVSQYTFRRENGDVVKMLGTYDIDCKIIPADVGLFVEVVYVGENREVRRGDNYMKVFRVQVEERKSMAAAASGKFTDGTEITDEDIPF